MRGHLQADEDELLALTDSTLAKLRAFFAVIFLALIFIGAMMLGISFRFTRQSKTLADNLQAFGKKDLDVRMEDSTISEIHEISVIFNEMAERIQYLIEQVYEKKLLAARSQTKYLQAQINPHFQFNILAMFSIRARLAGDVVPTNAREANNPKSRNRSELVNINPRNAPMVVKLPTVSG